MVFDQLMVDRRQIFDKEGVHCSEEDATITLRVRSRGDGQDQRSQREHNTGIYN